MSEQNTEFEHLLREADLPLPSPHGGNYFNEYLARYVKFAKSYADIATTEANKRIAEIESEVAELKELLSDRTQDLEFEYNRAEENFLSCGILQSEIDKLNEIHEGINCPVCGSLAVSPKEIWYTKQITELQANNNDLREALEYIVISGENSIDADDKEQMYAEISLDYIREGRKILSTTPAESLAKRDDEDDIKS